MKSVLLSIRLKYFYLTYKAIKKLEIRKSMPKDFTGTVFEYISATNFEKDLQEIPKEDREFFSKFKGKVGLEFTLNKVTKHEKNYIDIEGYLCYNFSSEDVKKAGFYLDDKNAISTIDTLCEFDLFVERYGRGKTLYAWHIEDLKIYDKPKELSEFSAFIPNNECNEDCQKCNAYNKEYNTCLACMNLCKTLKRPPQSWCYVEEIKCKNY